MAIDSKYLHSETSDKILKAFYTVRSGLLYGLDLEIYRRALLIEMASIGLSVEKDKNVNVMYKGNLVGSVILDFVVDDKIIIKLTNKMDEKDQQEKDEMLNQLRLTNYEVGLILSFHPDGRHRRVIFTGEKKPKQTNN